MAATEGSFCIRVRDVSIRHGERRVLLCLKTCGDLWWKNRCSSEFRFGAEVIDYQHASWSAGTIIIFRASFAMMSCFSL